jgi:glycosyltransferase involved in cell wall biosynthesis
VGLLAARLLGFKSTGIYHTDFGRQADHFIGDEDVSRVIDQCVNAFYRMMDEIRVPTRQYIRILASRGLDPSVMKIFRRRIDPVFSQSSPERRAVLREKYDVPDGITLLWVGRLGKEKNLDFLMDIYADVSCQCPGVNLMIVGDGPEYKPMLAATADMPRVIMTGRMEHDELADFYSLADLLVFPSTTDTFGMVVLEAQACGLPALVTDVGGPQELVQNGRTGYVLRANDLDVWVTTILSVINMIRSDSDRYRGMRQAARLSAHQEKGWEKVLEQLMGPQPGTPRPRRSAVAAPAH